MRNWIAVLILVGSASFVSCFGQDLQPLKYNHPGLMVDLGVGLWAWPIPCDADGDGDYDLIVSCPDKPSNGVWLFENTQGDTTVHKMPVFKPGKRLSATKYYVMPSYVDGKMRVLSPGFEYKDFNKTGLDQRMPLPLAANFYKPEGPQTKGPKVRHNQWRYVDYDGDGKLDLVTGIEDWSYYGWDDAWNERGEWVNGPLHGFVLIHRNLGTDDAPKYAPPFHVLAEGERISVYGCPSPNFADFDGDGDLDLLCGEFLDGFTYFENVGTRTKPQYRSGIHLLDASGAPLRMDLQMIVPVAFDWNKDGFLDLIVGDEDGRVALIGNTGTHHRDRSPIFNQPRYFQQEADTLKCGALATPVGFDWDADGDIDLISGNTAGYIEWFENLSGKGVANPKWAAPKKIMIGDKPFRIKAGPNGSIQGPAEAKWGYTTFSVADWDQNGLPDIVLNSILGEVCWLKNVGNRHVPRFTGPIPIEVEWKTEQPALKWGWRKPTGKGLLTQWRTTPVVHDLNRDGLHDLIMLDHEGYLAYFPRTKMGEQLLLQQPQRILVDESGQALRLNAKPAGGSGRRKLCVADWDGDGVMDLLVNSKNADWYRGLGEKNGKWMFSKPQTLAKQNIEGHDVSPTVVDFDADGIPDFVGGAEDGRMYFLRNPRNDTAK
ncbi:MAG: VCBS repeat-containing protein [Planctomycetia bacterium]|nr:VCBS repeat-containing protein [Planctomycetia bacterium]